MLNDNVGAVNLVVLFVPLLLMSISTVEKMVLKWLNCVVIAIAGLVKVVF